MRDIDPIPILEELVAIPSVNPMGGDPENGNLRESRLTEFLEEFFRERGIETLRQEAEPGRDNLLARIEGSAGSRAPVVVLDAHQDTVPVEGMTIAPWTPVIRDGRLFGRGSCDTKGPMAAMIVAALRASAVPRGRRPTVILSFPVNEEFGFTGIRRLCESSGRFGGALAEGFIPRTPTAAVVGEPTDLAVITAHKGAVRWRIHSHGRAAHSSRPELGENAIFMMAEVLNRLKEYQATTVGELAADPLCGKPTLSVGTIRGGVSVNVVPEECVIEVDRRVVPGEDAHDAREHLLTAIEGLEGITHDDPFLDLPPLAGTANAAVASRLCDCIRAVKGAGRTTGASYGTHAAFYARRGIPAVVFGPGSIEQAHTQDEWVTVDQVRESAEILYRFLLEEGSS